MKIDLAYPKRTERGIRRSLILDGERISVHQAHIWGDYGWIYSTVISERFRCATSDNLPGSVKWWRFNLGALAPAAFMRFHLNCDATSPWLPPAYLELDFDIESWRQPWTIIEFCSAFVAASRIYAKGRYTAKYQDELAANGLRIACPFPSTSDLLGVSFDGATKATQGIYQNARIGLAARAKESSLFSLFDFPEEHRAACKQYLVYFGEFLRLLGVKADTEVSDEAERVLLAVTPADGKAALVFAKAALNVFLRLPDARVAREDLNDRNPSLRNLALAITHLQAVVVGETQPIQLIENARECAAGGRVEEKAAFFDGRLKLKKFEKGPLELDLPRIIRELREKFPFLKCLE